MHRHEITIVNDIYFRPTMFNVSFVMPILMITWIVIYYTLVYDNSTYLGFSMSFCNACVVCIILIMDYDI